ncbi:MAG: AAA family ATPase, partial [Planctomycetota bacterium]
MTSRRRRATVPVLVTTFSAIAHTDIQGSTRLWERLGPGFAPLLSEHNRILRESAKAGREIATEGDSFTFEFPSADEAVAFALTAQRALHDYPWPALAGELLVRIGVHAGDVQGDANAAAEVAPRARLIAAAAHGGQILLTAQARGLAGNALALGVLTDLGEHRLAAHDRPERIFQLLSSSLPARLFPPARTLSSRPTNISSEPDRFVGRTQEFQEISALLPTQAGRLVTLTGPGGIGKSRLAREIALALLPQFEGGCWLADLMEARTSADVSRAVAHALGVPLPAGEDPAAAVADALEYRKPLLLVIDGFEALVDHAAATIGLWTRHARQVRFLVTSISLLGLSGEREVALGPLSSPGSLKSAATAQGLEAFEAAQLFLDRATLARPGFRLSDGNASAVGRICADLEGIPLAIELAAARLAELPPEEMLRELESQFHLRDTSPTGGPRRRQSLAGALEWSYGLLSEWQKSAFHQVCAFRGGFFLESAEDVIDLSAEPDAPLAIDAVQALRDRSLLRTHDTPFGTRFSFFRAIRDFGERHFRESRGEAPWRALEDRHARHFNSQVRRWTAAGPSAASSFDRLDLELDNFFAIQDRFLARAAAGDATAAAT